MDILRDPDIRDPDSCSGLLWCVVLFPYRSQDHYYLKGRNTANSSLQLTEPECGFTNKPYDSLLWSVATEVREYFVDLSWHFYSGARLARDSQIPRCTPLRQHTTTYPGKTWFTPYRDISSDTRYMGDNLHPSRKPRTQFSGP